MFISSPLIGFYLFYKLAITEICELLVFWFIKIRDSGSELYLSCLTYFANPVTNPNVLVRQQFVRAVVNYN